MVGGGSGGCSSGAESLCIWAKTCLLRSECLGPTWAGVLHDSFWFGLGLLPNDVLSIYRILFHTHITDIHIDIGMVSLAVRTQYLYTEMSQAASHGSSTQPEMLLQSLVSGAARTS